MNKPNAITGDRPTGPLHLGHYVGSIRNRLALQHTHDLTVLVADMQALTDHQGDTHKVRESVLEVMRDYLAVGLDPARCTFVLQSAVPQLCELTVLLMNLISVSHLERNPTIRSEVSSRGFARDIPAGFLCYPVSQAADILGLGGGVVPVGEDQMPVVEVCSTLARRIDRRLEAAGDERRMPGFTPLMSECARLPDLLGNGKMSKSSGAPVGLGASAAEIEDAVNKMFTDPLHIKITDPGRVEGNVVFSFLEAFDPDKTGLDELKDRYRQGGVGDRACKQRLLKAMETELAPIRQARARLGGGDEMLLDLLAAGSQKARSRAQGVLDTVRAALAIRDLPRPSLAGRTGL